MTSSSLIHAIVHNAIPSIYEKLNNSPLYGEFIHLSAEMLLSYLHILDAMPPVTENTRVQMPFLRCLLWSLG